MRSTIWARSRMSVSRSTCRNTPGTSPALGTLRLLEGIRDTGIDTRFYQASSSEQFGRAQEIPQRETTPFYPRSPYGVAKVYAHWITVNYRESYDLHASCGILFNHEIPTSRRNIRVAQDHPRGGGDQARTAGMLYLGNLDAQRDWGYARDYVAAMWLMLQQDRPDDYVVATGEMHSVRDFLDEAFGHLDLDWAQHVEIDPRYFRPAEVDELLGDASKAREKLGWTPTVTFSDLVKIMVDHDVKELRDRLGPPDREDLRRRLDLQGRIKMSETFPYERVAVTGGAGFLGRHVVDRLRDEGVANIFVPRRADYDLVTPDGVQRFYDDSEPDS